MKLINADLRRYRSIEDAPDIAVEGDVTCLVGKNESGKTAVLQALFKSHPIAPTPFDEGLDYPSRFTRERRKITGAIPVSVLTYRLDEDDIAAVDSELGSSVMTSETITVTHYYRRSTGTWKLTVNELAAVEHLQSRLPDLPNSTSVDLQSVTTIEQVEQVLDAMETPTPASTGVLATIAGWRNKDLELAAIDILSERVPRFVYFGDYDTMPGLVSIPELIEKRDSGELSRGQQAILALLDIAGVDPEEFQDPESHEHLIRDLENASNGISAEVFQYWTQNQKLAVQLRVIDKAEPNALPPLNRVPLLQTRVLNKRHDVSVPFDERSRGFVWFFSFLAYFSYLEDNAEQPLILLLDEPGLNLHGTAQADLLRFIEARLAPNHQVIFTTHSPYMIDAHQMRRVRTVVDDAERGTVVSDDVLRADAETAFPLYAALGIELSQNLFIGDNVFLVEGSSDFTYLQVLSALLLAEGRQGLDDRWVMTPAGGIAKLPAFVTLLGANKLNTVVLTDSSSSDNSTITKLREAGKMHSGGMIAVGDVLDRDIADIEDLFEPSFYLELVNRAYQGPLGGTPLLVSDLPDDKRLVRRVERAFEARGVNNGRLNHFAPAAALLRQTGDLTSSIDRETLDRAERLFTEVNKRLRG